MILSVQLRRYLGSKKHAVTKKKKIVNYICPSTLLPVLFMNILCTSQCRKCCLCILSYTWHYCPRLYLLNYFILYLLSKKHWEPYRLLLTIPVSWTFLYCRFQWDPLDTMNMKDSFLPLIHTMEQHFQWYDSFMSFWGISSSNWLQGEGREMENCTLIPLWPFPFEYLFHIHWIFISNHIRFRIINHLILVLFVVFESYLFNYNFFILFFSGHRKNTFHFLPQIKIMFVKK